MGDDAKLEAALIALEARIAEELSGSDERPELARALERRARLLGRLRRFPEADVAFADVLAEFGEDADPAVERVVVRARFNRALFRSISDDLPAAMSAVDELLDRHAADPPPDGIDLIVSGFALRAGLLWKLGRRDEATSLYAETLSRYREEEDLEARRDLARMLSEQATLAREDEQLELELRTLDSLIAEFADDEDSSIRKRGSRTLFRRALALRKLGRTHEAVVVWGALWERSKDDPDPPSETFAVTVLYNEAILLGRLERDDEARAVLDELIARFVDKPSDEVAKIVAEAVELRTQHISAGDDPPQGIEACDRLLAQIDGASAPSMQLAASKLMQLKLWELISCLRIDEAVDVARQLTRLFVEADEPSLVKQRGEQLVDAGRVLCFHPRFVPALKRPAIRVALTFGDRLGQHRRSELLERLPRPIQSRIAVVELCRPCQDQAAAMFEVVVARAAQSDDMTLNELAARAREAWASALKLRLHLVQMMRVAQAMVEQGDAAARMFESMVEREPLPTWRTSLLSFNALLTGEDDGPDDLLAKLRAYIDRYAEIKTPPAKVLVLVVRGALAYQTGKAALSRITSSRR